MKKLFVFLSAAVFAAGLALPVWAAEWQFYGSARLDAVYETHTNEYIDRERPHLDDPKTTEVDNLDYGLYDSKIGAFVQASETVSGHFEFGVGRDEFRRDAANVHTRIIIGHWNFGPGTLSVGQGYTPVNLYYSNRAFYQSEGIATGEPASGRRPMLQLAFGNFKLALVEVGDPKVVWGKATGKTKLPKAEFAFGHSFGLFSFDVVGGYQVFDIEAEEANDDPEKTDYDVHAWLVGGGMWIKPGAFRIGTTFYYSQNPIQFGQSTLIDLLSTGSGKDEGSYADWRFGAAAYDPGDVWTPQGVYNSHVWSVTAVTGYRASDMLDFEGGYSYIKGKQEEIFTPVETSWHSFYLQASVSLAPGVLIVPEFGAIYLQTKNEKLTISRDGSRRIQSDWERNRTIQYGMLKFQINF